METTISGGYENAPATKMLATHCAVCRRPLLDAVSVETGIGPECRKKYGFNAKVDEAARAEANAIVHEIALGWTVESIQQCERLRGLGFGNLAAIIEERACPIFIEGTLDGRISVKSPYNEAAVLAFRRVTGRRWDGEKKVNTFPVTSKAELMQVLKTYYAGLLAFGPKGAFVI